MTTPVFHGVTTIGTQGAETYRTLMKHAVDISSDWLASGTMFDGAQPDTVKSLLSQIDLFAKKGVGDKQALDEAAEYFLKHALQVHHPLCFAHLHCPTTLASQLAEVLINIANQSMDSWDQSPSATMFEQHIIRELRKHIGYPDSDAGVFTSGGTQSNFMGLLLAREYFVKSNPACDKRNLVVLCSNQAHFSVQQSMLLLGFDEDATVAIDCDEGGCINVAELRKTIAALAAQNKIPFALIATAGTTDTGAIDPITELASIAKQHSIWLHIDAAWGGILLFSQKYRHRIDGIELADSIALDFHKQFLQTISCGAFVLRDAKRYNLICRHDDYLNPVEDELEGFPNLVAKSIQTTRRFDALKLWMSFRSIGLDGYAAMVDYSVDLAQQVAQFIRHSSTFELVNSTQIASVLFRVKEGQLKGKDSTKFHRYIAQLLFDEGSANLGVTRRNGDVTLKMTLLNPATRFEDVEKLLQTIEQLLKRYTQTA